MPKALIQKQTLTESVIGYTNENFRDLSFFCARAFAYFILTRYGASRHKVYLSHLQSAILDQNSSHIDISWHDEDDSVITTYCSYSVIFSGYSPKQKSADFIEMIYSHFNAVFSVEYFQSLDAFDFDEGAFFNSVQDDAAYHELTTLLYELVETLPHMPDDTRVQRFEAFGEPMDQIWERLDIR